MNKVATYLNGHLTGEVLVNDLLLDAAQSDGSVLARRPEMIARPSNVNDIRKIMRFCSQLADKGHILSVVVRGAGTDSNGAATGGGVSLDMQAYMRHAKGIDPKQQLVHMQAGMKYSAVRELLSMYKNLALPEISVIGQDGTIGGAIASGAVASSVGLTTLFTDAISQMEIVLANGDVIQTGRINKRELAKKKGLSTLEGEIYRQVDNLLEDNQQIIDAIKRREKSTAGFWGITKVKGDDGSFDLTPLFVGSQGALGIISEVIMKAEYSSNDATVITATFGDMSEAQAAVDEALKHKVSKVDIIDGRIMARAASEGKKFSWAPREAFKGAAVIITMSEFSDRARGRAAKKLARKLENIHPVGLAIHDIQTQEIASLYTPLSFILHSTEERATCPAVFSGLWLPLERLDGFLSELRKVEAETKLALPVFVDAVNGYVDLLPVFNLHKVSERRVLLKLIPEIAKLVAESRGNVAGRYGDGRLKAGLMQSTVSPDETAIYSQIKHIFDPANILMPDIKKEVPAKELADELNLWCRTKS